MPKSDGTMTASERTAQLATNLAKLPEMCWSTMNVTGELIMLKKGETGFWPAEGYGKGQFKTWDEVADLLNERQSITKAQRKAMTTGSIFGFHAKGADPDYVSEHYPELVSA